MPLRITEDQARALLKQTQWLLTACVIAILLFVVLIFSASGDVNKMPSIALPVFLTYWLAGVLFLVWIGRLAYGLGRSVVYYVGGTLLLSSAIFMFAHIIAYTNIKKAVATAFGTKPTLRPGEAR